MAGIDPDDITVARDHFVSHLEGARAAGLDTASICEALGVSAAQLARSDSRISYAALNQVRLEICRLLDDENAGFLERPARWGSTVYFCRALVSSRTLREALYRYERFSAILSHEVKVRIVEGPQETAVEFAIPPRPDLDVGAEAENRIYFLLSFALWLTDRRFLPRSIGFAFPRPGYAEDYSQVVPCRYVFDAPVNRLVLDSAVLREPVRRSPRLLNQFLANHLFFLIQQNLAMSSVAEQVRRMLEADATADLESVSDALSIPTTTLRRRLKAEEVSFQRLKDEIRQRRAMHYLVDRRLTVAETAALVGFSDPAAFSRAFKAWTGRSPGEVARRGA
jgi:AraC-like DNA-binding protein